MIFSGLQWSFKVCLVRSGAIVNFDVKKKNNKFIFGISDEVKRWQEKETCDAHTFNASEAENVRMIILNFT